ncbi:ABC transporter ATP-binding protein/permease [Dongia sp.]|uniref:ABC transporter ATP-binding protein/permease n=1 Tax=Dongia sp. TaxID=1977262 RepID=UPI0037511CFE
MAKPSEPGKGPKNNPADRKAWDNVRPMTGATDGPMSERRGTHRPKSEPAKPRAGGAGTGEALISWSEFFKTFWRIAGPYWSSEEKIKVRLLTLALVVLTICQVGVPVALNRWMRWLFDALEQKAMHQFANLSGILLIILVSNVAIVNLHLRVKRRLQIGWRAWLSRQVEHNWMMKGRHYQIGYLPGPHDNPDGRIAEDIKSATEYAIDLGHSLFYDLLLLVSFTQILWSLSQAPYIIISNTPYYVPGYLVWLAVIYAGLGSGIALALGRPLIRAVDRRQTTEADFRFGLSHARENSLGIALAGGERDVRSKFYHLFDGVTSAWDSVTRALANMFFYSASWSVLSQVFPTLVVAPRYIAGLITLGVLIQSAQAFQQMVGALSWAIDNLGKVADWRASAERVFGLVNAVDNFDELLHTTTGKPIAVTNSEQPVLAFRNFSTTTPAGQPQIEDMNVEIRKGERILFTGETSAGSSILKAVAGVWPWGDGTIELPAGARFFFMPPRPYLPTGTLRAAIDYPTGDAPIDEAAIRAALTQVGLQDLIARLDESGKWDQVLTIDTQQRLGFARLLLKRPDWILMEEAADTLDPAGQRAMIDLLRTEFPKETVIAIGHVDTLLGAETRRFLLERNESGGVSVGEDKVQAHQAWA